MLRCTEKKLDKKNEKLALEIRKRKVETIERKKQILQLKAESEEIISTHHETFEFDDFSMTDESSIIPVRDPSTVLSTGPGLGSGLDQQGWKLKYEAVNGSRAVH